jgi:signal transduction histidine kinase
MDAMSRRAVGGTMRLLCQVRLAVLAFALVLALLRGEGWVGVLLVVLAAPFSLVPAVRWDTRGKVYARNGILLAADVVVTLVALLPLAGSPLLTVYAAATAAMWGLLAGLRLAVVMALPLCLYQLTLYDDGWRGLVTGLAGAALTVGMAWTGTGLGRRLRHQALLSAELASVREEAAALAERLRLARDLHDTVAGDLAGLTLAARGLADRLDRHGGVPGDCAGAARELSDAVAVAHRQTRRALGDLRDEPDGVAGPVGEAVRRWTTRTGIPVRVQIDEEVDAVTGPGRARHLRAMVAELLENVRKHADASRVQLRITTDGRVVEVLVDDDGSGLPARLPEVERYGIRGVRERAVLCDGDAVWTSGSAGGTAVRVVLPAEPPTGAWSSPRPVRTVATA